VKDDIYAEATKDMCKNSVLRPAVTHAYRTAERVLIDIDLRIIINYFVFNLVYMHARSIHTVYGNIITQK